MIKNNLNYLITTLKALEQLITNNKYNMNKFNKKNKMIIKKYLIIDLKKFNLKYKSILYFKVNLNSK